MKRPPNPFLAVIFVFAFSALGFSSATRYIAQSAGTFSGGTACNGQTTISAATFNSTTNGPGDVDYVCGTITGSAGGNVLTVVGSGSSGNPITLKFDTGASLSAPYCNSLGNSSGCLIISTPSNPRSYIVVDGDTPCGWTIAGGAETACNGTIVNTNSGTGLTTNTSTSAIEAEKCSHCEIKNLGIYNIYVQSGGDTNANTQYENCIVYSGSNNLIHDNRFHDVGWCLFYNGNNGDNNNEVYRNDVYNTSHPIYFTMVSGTASNAYFYENHFHDYANWNTSACVYHVEGFHSSGPNSGPFPVFNNLYYYNNLQDGDTGTCLYAQYYLSADTNSSGSTGLVNNSVAFNNKFISTTSGSSIVVVTGNGNQLFNNTIVYNDSTPAGGCLIWADIAENVGYTFVAKNNAVSGCLNIVNSNNTTTRNVTLDYNAYANASGGNCFTFVPGLTCNWTTYKANGAEDQHSVAGLGTSGPNCCQGQLGLDTSTWKPNTGSLVIGAGTNLTSVCSGQPNPGLGALCYDYDGLARPSSGAWNAGAYQNSSQQGPAPPAALTAAVH